MASLVGRFLSGSARTVYRTGKFAGRLALEAGMTAGRGVISAGRVGARAIPIFDRLAFNRVEPHMNNWFTGRTAKPWFLGSLAVAAFLGGFDMGQQISASISAQPGEIPALFFDGIRNFPDDMGADGELAIALHKNRHG